MLLAMFCFAIMAIFIRFAGDDAHTTVIVCMRNVLSLLILLPFIMKDGVKAFKTDRMGRHVMRSAIGIISMHMWFYSLLVMPVSEAVALSFTTPIFVTILAMLFLGERAGIRRWSAIIIGFVGTLVILRPEAGNISQGAYLVLVSSFLMAVVSILVKTLTKTDNIVLIVFYMALFMAIFAAPGAWYFWEPFGWETLGYMAGIAVSSTFAHLFLAKAYTKAEMVVLMPFDFSRLIFVSLFAFIFFNEWIDWWTVLGALIIVASTAYIAHREAVLNRKLPHLDPERIGR
jgi:drug/metabolite transporter (DMT)-like permease